MTDERRKQIDDVLYSCLRHIRHCAQCQPSIEAAQQCVELNAILEGFPTEVLTEMCARSDYFRDTVQTVLDGGKLDKAEFKDFGSVMDVTVGKVH